MAESEKMMTRRVFVQASSWACLGLGMGATLRATAAETFPAHNMDVVVPTGEGGAADRLVRVFCQTWAKHLRTKFQFGFFPGAAGEVGYQVYLGQRKADGYNLLFGNMGPEVIMYAVQHPPYKFPQDYAYFCRVDVDDSVVFVAQDSPIKTLKELVELAKKKTVTVATSRLPHPASIGMLALAEATGAKFNLVPYGGGNPTMSAVLTGEVQSGILPASTTIRQSGQTRVLGVFSNENKLSARLGGAPSVNQVFGTHIPDLPSSHAWALQTAAMKHYPDRYAKLLKSAKAVFADPAFEADFKKTGVPWSEAQFGDEQVCMKYADDMLKLAERYRELISAARGR